MGTAFTPEERRALEAALGRGERGCPRCGGALDTQDVPPRREVSYVRHRVWLVCGACGGTAVVDRKRIERAGGS